MSEQMYTTQVVVVTEQAPADLVGQTVTVSRRDGVEALDIQPQIIAAVDYHGDDRDDTVLLTLEHPSPFITNSRVGSWYISLPGEEPE